MELPWLATQTKTSTEDGTSSIHSSPSNIALDLSNKKYQYETFENQLKTLEQQALQHSQSIVIEQKQFLHQMQESERTETNESKMQLLQIRLKKVSRKKASVKSNSYVTDTATTASGSQLLSFVLPQQKDVVYWYRRWSAEKLILTGVTIGVCSYILYKYVSTGKTPRKYSIKYK
eukprot:UN12912